MESNELHLPAYMRSVVIAEKKIVIWVKARKYSG